MKDLAEHHKKMLLEESGIKPDVVEARGYRTVKTKAELKRLGFSDAQRITPALLIPIFGPDGEIATHQIRPDAPRWWDGKPIKYETPRGSRMALDVNPLVRGQLSDPSIPLFITEGVKKGDAIVSRGHCAIALLGVWNWRGTNEHGGKVALPDWEYVALNDEREVHVLYDSDVMAKPEVYKALVRFKNFLEHR